MIERTTKNITFFTTSLTTLH